MDWLFAPVDIAWLIFFRIFFGAMMLAHVASMIASGWIAQLYIRPVVHFTYPGFGWVRLWPGIGMYVHYYVLGLAAAGILTGCWYRFCAIVFACGMTHAFLVEKAFYLNHHYLICLISVLMVFMPAHRAFSVDAWRNSALRSQQSPAWCLWLMRLQLAIPYFYGGLAKLDADWLRGFPLGMWLQRKSHLPWLGTYLNADWAPLAFSYGGMLFDLFVVPLLLWKRTRVFAYGVSILFHLMNAALFEIGIFPWFMIGGTLLFFPADWPRRLLKLPPISSHVAGTFEVPSRRRTMATASLLGLYCAWQLLFPLRSYFYPGPPSWTEEGHHFAWHMMLREKDVGLRFYVRDRDTGAGGVVDVRTFLTTRQMTRMSKDSDMIVTFVHFLRDHFRAHGQGNLQIRVLALVSLNGRRPQLMLDPTIDFARVRRTWGHQPWIVPLHEPLRETPWTEPLEAWENLVAVPTPEEMVQEAAH